MQKNSATIDQILRLVPDLRNDDAQFLGRVLGDFPRVCDGFRQFTELRPIARIKTAAETLEHQPRSGWLRLEVEPGTSDVLATHFGEYYGDRILLLERDPKRGESVLRHSIEGAELYANVFPREPHIQLAIEVLKFHDFVEAIDGDFTPQDKLSRPDKERLEKIAIALLTESRKTGDLLALHVYNCMRIFEGEVPDFAPLQREMLDKIAQQPGAASNPFVAFARDLYSKPLPDLARLHQQVKDIDRLQMGVRGLIIIRDEHYNVARDKALEEMDRFWSYIDQKLITAEARTFFRELSSLYRAEGGHTGSSGR